MKITIGENIKKLRESRKLKQEQLGNHIGVGGATISSWGTGRTEPNMGNTQALADLFGISTDELIYGKKISSPKSQWIILSSMTISHCITGQGSPQAVLKS